MATRPDLHVHKESVTTNDAGVPGMASTIAVIGAFDSEVTDVTVCATKEAAHTIFGTTSTVGNFKGTDAIDGLFYGASALIVVNITTWSDDETPVASTTLTTEKLTAALAKLKHEAFDLLFIADELADASQTLVSTWLDAELEDKYAHGQVSQLQKSTTAAYTTSIATYNDQICWITTQSYNSLSLNESAALMAGYIASLMVNRSLTYKEIPFINSISPEYTTESGDIGAKLLELSVPFVETYNRTNSKYICVNSELPNKLDLYINPKTHHMYLLDGWEYMKPRFSTTNYYLHKIRTIAKDLMYLDRAPKKCIEFLDGEPMKDAYSDFKAWDDVIEHGFSGHNFHHFSED